MARIQDSILLFGDSLTQGSYELNGLAARLGHIYNRRLDVINRGFSGYNAVWGSIVFRKVFPTREAQPALPRVALLLIWFGANDACLPIRTQHVPLPTFTSTLTSLIKAVRDPESAQYSPSTKIILITPPPFSAALRQAELDKRPVKQPMDRSHAQTREYAEAVKTTGRKESVPVADVWSALWSAASGHEDGLKQFFTDGLHLNEAGYAVVYKSFMSVIESEMPELLPNNVPMAFAPWDAIDPENPEKSLELRRTGTE